MSLVGPVGPYSNAAPPFDLGGRAEILPNDLFYS